MMIDKTETKIEILKYSALKYIFTSYKYKNTIEEKPPKIPRERLYANEKHIYLELSGKNLLNVVISVE
jgi:hypothetical protein